MKPRTGLIGWRGMVGSVLMERMTAEGDFDRIEPVFFSSSQQGQPGPVVPGVGSAPLEDADDLRLLAAMDIIISCQGSDFTHRVYPALRGRGWKGHWIDASSALRMADESAIVLDPVNRPLIEKRLAAGTRTWSGGNCTVSLLLMALAGIVKPQWVEWISTMTYQAVSGAGAAQMRRLLNDMGALHHQLAEPLADPAASLLDLEAQARRWQAGAASDTAVSLAANLVPCIGEIQASGQSSEEAKGQQEACRILDCSPSDLAVDGLCVRVGSLRCHAQAVTLRLTRELPLETLEQSLVQAHPWIELVPNEPEASMHRLTPAAVSGSLRIAVGRVRPMNLGPRYLTLFTLGDQLLWGAAEPLRRMLGLLLEA